MASAFATSWRGWRGRRRWNPAPPLEYMRAFSTRCSGVATESATSRESSTMPTALATTLTSFGFAPAAARGEAAALGAHRQAASHYAAALGRAEALPSAERASLLEGFSYEQHLVGRIDDAVRAREEALTLRRSIDDRRSEGADLRSLSRLAWLEGRRSDAVAFGEEAIAVLEPLGPTPELAMACSNLAWLFKLADDSGGGAENTGALSAIGSAEQVGDVETLVHALTTFAIFPVSGDVAEERGTAAVGADHRPRYARHGLHDQAIRAYTLLATFHIVNRNCELAAIEIEQALRFALDHDLATWGFYILGWRARLGLRTRQLGSRRARRSRRRGPELRSHRHPLSAARGACPVACAARRGRGRRAARPGTVTRASDRRIGANRTNRSREGRDGVAATS